MSLEPPDRAQCQCMIREAYSPARDVAFRMGGQKPKPARCTKSAFVIVTEVTPGPDGQCGSMSLCADCLAVFQKETAGCTPQYCIEVVT